MLAPMAMSITPCSRLARYSVWRWREESRNWSWTHWPPAFKEAQMNNVVRNYT